MTRYYSSIAVDASLAVACTALDTTIQLTAVAGMPTQFPFTLILDFDRPSEEVVDVTAVAGTTVTVVRGVDGTSAMAHTAGAPVRHGVSARDFIEAQASAENSQSHAGDGGIHFHLSDDAPSAVAAGAAAGTSGTAARSDHVHSGATGNHTHTGMVLSSRKISTTAPLTGGGDLSADRTLAITTGTTAGTVATGDHTHPSVLTADQPQAVKVAGSVGTATTAARADHVHPGAVLLDPVSGVTQTVNGPLSVKRPTGSTYLCVDTPNAATITGVNLQQGGKSRWILKKTSEAETGGNTGSNLELGAMGDDGATVLSIPFSANRQTGDVSFGSQVAVGGGVTTGQSVIVTTTGSSGVIVGTDAPGKNGGLYIRDSGQATAKNRWSVTKNGDAETGSNAGSNFRITAMTDAGAGLHTSVAITRSTGIVSIKTALAARSMATSAAYAAHVEMVAETVVDDSGAETVMETEMLDIAGVIAALSAEVQALKAEVAVLRGGA